MNPEYEELLNNFERYLDSMSQTEFDSIVESMAKERDNGESFDKGAAASPHPLGCG